MEVTPKKCQVVMRKIMLGDRGMHKCIIPLKRLSLHERQMLSKPWRGDRMPLCGQHQKFSILLHKLKLSHGRCSDGRVSPVSRKGDGKLHSARHAPPNVKGRQFRVLLRRMKLDRVLQERLDHTLFIHKELGFVTNPYLIPDYYRSRLNRTQVEVLKFGRRSRSRAGRCRVRIRKLQL
ncbi:uncharacterized protein [Diadema antillarum]|uniref:uncharacterized protein n=1 Tax=Diadema antillarum TaxID=105358 RepID=UPI003A87C97E